MSQKHLLDVDLEHYSVTARMVLNLKPPAKRLGDLMLYTAAAGSALALAPVAEASIIYSGIRNITVSGTGTAQADLNGNSKSNIKLNISNGSDTSNGNFPRFNLAFLSPVDRKVEFLDAYVNGAPIFFPGNLGIAKLNASTTSIKSVPANQNTWATSNLLRGMYRHSFDLHPSTLISSNSVAGRWNPGMTGTVNGFAGIKFANNDLGWLHLKLTTNNGVTNSLTLVDWAYQSVPGASIHVGDTGATTPSVPEPSSLGLMALGAAGIAMLRRRRSSGKDAEQQAY